MYATHVESLAVTFRTQQANANLLYMENAQTYADGRGTIEFNFENVTLRNGSLVYETNMHNHLHPLYALAFRF